MKKSKNAFTMIEAVFVIVILGILAAVAIPKFAATRLDAQISKGRADIASIRSAIVSERQVRLIRGDSSWINQLHSSSTSYFDGNGTASTDSKLLMYGIAPENNDGHWVTGASCAGTTPNVVCTYKFRLEGNDNTFTYNQSDGTFKCTQSATTAPRCNDLTR